MPAAVASTARAENVEVGRAGSTPLATSVAVTLAHVATATHPR